MNLKLPKVRFLLKIYILIILEALKKLEDVSNGVNQFLVGADNNELLELHRRLQGNFDVKSFLFLNIFWILENLKSHLLGLYI